MRAFARLSYLSIVWCSQSVHNRIAITSFLSKLWSSCACNYTFFSFIHLGRLSMLMRPLIELFVGICWWLVWFGFGMFRRGQWQKCTNKNNEHHQIAACLSFSYSALHLFRLLYHSTTASSSLAAAVMASTSLKHNAHNDSTSNKNTHTKKAEKKQKEKRSPVG